MSGSDCNDTGNLDALASILTHLKFSVSTMWFMFCPFNRKFTEYISNGLNYAI